MQQVDSDSQLHFELQNRAQAEMLHEHWHASYDQFSSTVYSGICASWSDHAYTYSVLSGSFTAISAALSPSFSTLGI